MGKNEAPELAIEALEQLADETYEGSERDEPECAAWIKRQEDAANVLRTLMLIT